MKIHIRPDTIEANRIARKLRLTGSPTTGKEAARLWEICSCHHGIGVLTARKLYLKAGYIPFRGYPLERKPI